MSHPLHHIVLKPRSGWAALDLKELWEYRDVMIMLALRDIKLRYKQTALGIIWVILQPLAAGIIFTVIFGHFARLPSDGHPYLLFVFCGLAAWYFFSSAVLRAGNSLITDSKLITKVYFPRLLVPLAGTFAVLVDFAVMLGLLLVIFLFYQQTPTIWILTLPLFIILTIILATGVSLWLSALNVKYRDFTYAMPFLVQLWMFASPVVYAGSIIPEKWRYLYFLNPVSGIIEGFRLSLLGSSSLNALTFSISSILTIIIFLSGAFYFKRVEKEFADII